MASHPYISGPGNITQIVGFLRKNFPATVNAETVKKFGLASQNESYVINALQFIGIINEEGKRTDAGQKVFIIHNEEEFQKAFSDLIRNAYKDLFDLWGDDAWTRSKEDLIGYFRNTDKTSEVIGTRQSAVFKVFAALAGHGSTDAPAKSRQTTSKPKDKTTRPSSVPRTRQKETLVVKTDDDELKTGDPVKKKDLVDKIRHLSPI